MSTNRSTFSLFTFPSYFFFASLFINSCLLIILLYVITLKKKKKKLIHIKTTFFFFFFTLWKHFIRNTIPNTFFALWIFYSSISTTLFKPQLSYHFKICCLQLVTKPPFSAFTKMISPVHMETHIWEGVLHITCTLGIFCLGNTLIHMGNNSSSNFGISIGL